ncbi:MAG: DUF4142 domain-containing protein [Sphingomicrobium sp.]
MNKTLIVVLASTALTISACKKNDVDATANQDVTMSDNGMMTNDAMAAPAALPTTAADFVNAAAASDKFEVDSSKLAAGSASSASVKAFAAKMVAGHSASTAKLEAAIAGMTPALTPSDMLNPAQQTLLAGLQGKTGADFDAAYKDAQVTAHQATLDALNSYANGGDNAKLQALAKGMIPTVTAHLNMAKGLK